MAGRWGASKNIREKKISNTKLVIWPLTFEGLLSQLSAWIDITAFITWIKKKS
jgi:hypothetical protein